MHWAVPHTIFRTPSDLWGDVEIRGIWAPEMHEYRGKYYLFLTFDGQLMMVLHQPNDGDRERARLFEIEDAKEALLISRDFPR